jgi:hypothetical protein
LGHRADFNVIGSIATSSAPGATGVTSVRL